MKVLIAALLLASFSFCSLSLAGNYDITTGPAKMPDKIMITHNVERQDELHLLSAYYQLNPRTWRNIYNANNTKIKNPNLIYPGQEFQVEVYEDWKAPYDMKAWKKANPRW